jgi:hypothetical protein
MVWIKEFENSKARIIRKAIIPVVINNGIFSHLFLITLPSGN